MNTSDYQQLLKRITNNQKLTNTTLYNLTDSVKKSMFDYLLAENKPIFDAILLTDQENFLQDKGYTRYHHPNGLVLWTPNNHRITQPEQYTEAVIREKLKEVVQIGKLK